ncbi:MAG: S1 RNA-binding domain-containing protein, partial [Turicibacter sp.]
GAFVQLDEEYNGLIHISELSDGYVKDIRDFVNIGEFVDVKIIRFDSESRQVRLSLKEVTNNNYRYNRIKASDFETPNGFEPLEKNLPKWIADSIDKLSK